MTIAEFLLYAATGFRILGILIFMAGVLPAMYQETRVKDGLISLRWSILICTLIYVILQIVGLTSFITSPREVEGILDIVRLNPYFNALSLINSLGIFVIAIIMYLIYHREYREPFL